MAGIWFRPPVLAQQTARSAHSMASLGGSPGVTPVKSTLNVVRPACGNTQDSVSGGGRSRARPRQVAQGTGEGRFEAVAISIPGQFSDVLDAV